MYWRGTGRLRSLIIWIASCRLSLLAPETLSSLPWILTWTFILEDLIVDIIFFEISWSTPSIKSNVCLMVLPDADSEFLSLIERVSTFLLMMCPLSISRTCFAFNSSSVVRVIILSLLSIFEFEPLKSYRRVIYFIEFEIELSISCISNLLTTSKLGILIYYLFIFKFNNIVFFIS